MPVCAMANPPSNLEDVKRILEAVLLAQQQPLSLAELRKVFEDAFHPDFLRRALDELRQA